MEKVGIQRTLVLIKPDGVERGLIGEIIKRFEQRGLKIVALKMLKPPRELVEKHYEVHKGKPFYEGLVNFLSNGVVVAMVIEGVNAIDYVRSLIGSTEPGKALPGTIRGDFSHLTKDYANVVGMAVKNLVHASDSEESAKREIELWFNEDEICNYKRVEEVHIFGW